MNLHYIIHLHYFCNITSTTNTMHIIMKKHFLFFTIIFMIVSCSPTNEERAEKLVSDCIKDYLTYPDSYEAISTIIDSTSINVSIIEEILLQAKEVAEYHSKFGTLERKIESAQFTIRTNDPYSGYYSEWEREKYNRAESEKEECELEIQRLNERLYEDFTELKELADNLYNEEDNGWFVIHRFRSKSNYGESQPPQEMIFFCDLNFEWCQGWTSQQYEIISKIINYIIDSETEKELLDNLKDMQIILFLYNYY